MCGGDAVDRAPERALTLKIRLFAINLSELDYLTIMCIKEILKIHTCSVREKKGRKWFLWSLYCVLGTC